MVSIVGVAIMEVLICFSNTSWADTLRRNATFFTKGSYYSYICIKDGGYTYKGTASPIKKGVPGGPDTITTVR